MGDGSQKSGSKKTPADGKSAMSPNGGSEAEGQSMGRSQKQSAGMEGMENDSQEDSYEDGDGMDGDMDGGQESADEMGDLPSQNEMKRELIVAIEEEMRE